MTEAELDAYMVANMGKITRTCQEFSRGKITREECRRIIVQDCNVAETPNLDALIDAYDPTKP
jgi:hypothetical protein